MSPVRGGVAGFSGPRWRLAPHGSFNTPTPAGGQNGGRSAAVTSRLIAEATEEARTNALRKALSHTLTPDFV